MKLHGTLNIYLAILLCTLSAIEAETISQSLLEKFSNGVNKTNIIIEFPSVSNRVLSNPALNLLRGAGKTSFMKTLMKKFTTQAQFSLLSKISEIKPQLKFTPFYISNLIFVENVHFDVINILVATPGDFIIREPETVLLDQNDTSHIPNFFTVDSKLQWGVSRIGAPYVWKTYGLTGKGIIIANIDTGVNKDHEPLRDNFAGGWFDAISGKEETYDNLGHGTWTMGIACGRTLGIGVAPNATWIACKALGYLGGSEEALITCGQWILDQRPLPNIVNNIWASKNRTARHFDDMIAHWRAVGIIPVFGIGNSVEQRTIQETMVV